MKNRMRLGQPFLALIMFCFFVALPIVVIVFMKEDPDYIGDLIVSISFSLISLFVLSFNDNFGGYMVLQQDKVSVKVLFRTKKEYLKEELTLQYGVYELSGRSGRQFLPCLLISRKNQDKFLFSKETTGNKNLFQGEYFLVLLTNIRLKKIEEYFNKQIQLPKEWEWKEYCQSSGIYAKNLSKFYRKIGEYNNSLV